MGKPVEIEFLMRDKLTPGLENAGKAGVNMGNDIEQSSQKIKAGIEEQNRVIKQLESDLKKLDEVYKTMGSEKAQLQVKAEIDACKVSLDKEKTALVELKNELDNSVEKHTSLRSQIRTLKEEMAAMTEGTEEYNAAMQRLGKLTDRMGDISQQGSVMADDERNIRAATDALTGFTGAMTAGTGIASLFGLEEEKLSKIQTKLQAVMAISMGIQQVANTLNKDSYFRIIILGKAKDLLTASTTRLSVALGISNVAAKALMATLTLGLSVAIGAVIYLWDKFSTAQAKAKKAVQEFNEKVSEMVGDTIPNFKKMVIEWEKLGDSMEEKEKYIRDNQDAFKKLGVEIHNVIEAENLFKDGKDAFIESLYLRAKAAASMELAADKYKEAVKKMMEADAMPDKVTKFVSYGTNYGMGMSTSYEVDNGKKQKLNKQVNELEEEAQALLKKGLDFSRQESETLTKANIKTAETIVEGSVAAIEASISSKREALKKLTNKTDYDQSLKLIEAEEKRLKAITGTGNSGGKSSSDKPKNTLAEMELRAQQKIEDTALALRQEGYDKQRAQAELNFQREKERIAKEEKERLELYEKLLKAGEKVTPEQKVDIKAQASIQRVQAGQVYDNSVNEIKRQEQKDREETLKKLLEPYRTFAQQRLDIEKKYQDDIAEMRKAGASEENIQLAEEAQSDALSALDDEMAQRDATFQDLMSRIGYMSLTQLEQSLKDAENALKKSEATNGKDNKQSAVLRAKIKTLQSEIKALKTENEMNAPTDIERWNKTSTAIKKCKKEVDGILDSMDFLDESTKEALKAASNVAEGAIGMIDGIKMLSIGAAQGISAVEKASVILAIVGAAVQIITAIFNMASAAEDRHQKALAEISANKLALQREYNLLLLEQNLLLKEATTIFGEKQIEKAANAVEVYRHALELYKAELTGQAPKMNFLEQMTNDVFGTYQKRLDDYEKGIGALNEITVKTGHEKTGLFGWGKGRDIYSSLMDVYGIGENGLVDEAGRLNVELAKTILNTQTMSDENKALLQSLINLQEEADKAQEALRDYLQETFGDLGDGIMESITDAIQSGDDAWEKFGEKGAEVLERLGKQIAYSLFFADKFKRLQQQLEEIYGSGKTEEQIAQDAMNLVGDFYNNIGKDMDTAQAWMENWKKEAAGHGFDLWGTEGSSQTGKAGAFTTLTQEQGTKLEGMFTSVQGHTSSIDDKLDDISGGIYRISDSLDEIKENTDKMVDRLDKVVEEIETIKRDGLKVK
jgi:hypothetical protein